MSLIVEKPNNKRQNTLFLVFISHLLILKFFLNNLFCIRCYIDMRDTRIGYYNDVFYTGSEKHLCF